MKRARILVVDDDPDLVELVKHHLVREHYEVFTAHDGERGLAEARVHVPDLILLDLMLPGIDGLEICRRLRADARTKSIPIVMLTAKGEETDAVVGLMQGADDYVRKPFGMKELLARIAARLRSVRGDGGPELEGAVRFGELVVDPVKHEVTLAGDPIVLTMSEFKLLHWLVAHKGRAFTRHELLDAIVGTEAVIIDRNVDVHVATLRKKLGEYGRHVITIRGLGYKFREAPTAHAE
ncbi:MAG: response regulator transcription factor [Planctomycetes bacterium]|nr:response regulator transcription factor [Planctomycetota bacterium]